jgi:hypothetical protein
MNPYAYVAQNPETLTDPSGQMYYCPQGCGGGGNNGNPTPPPPPNHGPTCGPDPSNCDGGGMGNPGAGGSEGGNRGYSDALPQLDGPASGSMAYLNYAYEYAYYMALEIEAYRIAHLDSDLADYAMGWWFITDASGRIIDTFLPWLADVGMGIAKSSRHGTNYDQDAEQKLLRAWEGSSNEIMAFTELKVLLLMGIQAQLHVVLFTQYAPCVECQNYFNSFLDVSAVMLTQVMNAFPRPSSSVLPTGSDTLTLDVFSSTNQSWPHVFDPGTVFLPGDVTLYWHGYDEAYWW